MPTRSYRNQNPGNLRSSAWTKALPGYVGQDAQGFARFGDYGFGLGAMIRLLRGTTYRDLTVEQAIRRYAPPSENDTPAYVEAVSIKAGVRTTAVLKDMAPGPFLRLVAAMVEHEGWKA